jgi:hypothetical protein
LTVPLTVQAQALAQNVPEIPIEPIEGFIKLPEGLYLGEALGVATNSQGHAVLMESVLI